MAALLAHSVAGLDPPVAVRLSGDARAIEAASAGIPPGAAAAEAVAARLRLDGARLGWGEPDHVDSDALLALCRARGASSVEIVRADPSLLPHLQLGGYFEARAFGRAARRLLLFVPGVRASPARAADAAFWRGVREAASPAEWRRVARSSYVVLYYHRVAERKPGQDRLNVAPRSFERQLRVLRRLGMHLLDVDELVRFHADAGATLPRRSVVLCADDAFRDAVLALRRHADLRPIVFVTTGAVGRAAPWSWADGEPIAAWPDLQEFAAAGGVVGSHARSHTPLPELTPPALAAELEESLRELRAHVPAAEAVLAYPHGEENEAVRAAARAAGYRLAFTTRAGRNGAGTDPFALRRIGPKDWDGTAAFAWKALTGEAVPWSIERRRLRVRGLR